MSKCYCRIRIEKGEKENIVFKACPHHCSKGCGYCAVRNLNRYDFMLQSGMIYMTRQDEYQALR